MTTLIRLCDRLRYLILGSLPLLVPILIDEHILIGAGPDTKFRFLEFGVLLAVLFSLPSFVTQHHSARFSLPVVAIMLLIGYWMLRALFDPFREFALDSAMQTVSCLLYALLVADACRSPRDFQRLVWLAVVTQLFTVLYAIGETFGIDLYFQYIRHKPWRWVNPMVGEDRGIIWSTLGNPNYYASYGALLLIWILTLIPVCRRRWSQALLSLYLGIVLYTLLYTFTRGIWVSLFLTAAASGGFAALFAVAHSGNLRATLRRFGVRAVIGLFVGVMLLGTEFVRESHRGHGPLHGIAKRFYHGFTFRDTSLRARPLMWFAALRLWREAPVFGEGHGRYGPRFLETVYAAARDSGSDRIHQITRQMNSIRPDLTHNDYLQLTAETGGIGLALFLFLLLAVLGHAVSTLWNPQSVGHERILLLGATAVVLQTAIQCGYDFPLHLPAGSLFFSLGLGGIILLTRHSQSAIFQFRLPTSLRWLSAGAACIVLIFTGSMVVRHLLASHLRFAGDQQLEDARKAMDANDRQELTHLRLAEEFLSRANVLYPSDGETLYKLGRAYYFLSTYESPEYRKRALERMERAKETFCIPELYQTLGLLYIEENRIPAAEKQADILLAVDPERKEVQFLAGMVDYLSGRFEKAVQHFREELRVYPDNDAVLGYLGLIYETYFHQYEAAAQAYEQKLEKNPNILEIRERLGDLYALHLHRLPQAREQYRAALELARAFGNRPAESAINGKLRELDRKIESRKENSISP